MAAIVRKFATRYSTEHNEGYHIGSCIGQSCWPIAQARGLRIEHWCPGVGGGQGGIPPLCSQ